MSICFVFSHGWGFDEQFWQPLSQYFSSNSCYYLNQGYFGKSIDIEIPSGTPVVGIGHSLGFSKLLMSGIKCHALIGLNAFTYFLGFSPTLHYRRKQELQLMRNHFLKNPKKTLSSFYKQSGFKLKDKTDLEKIAGEKLMTDLDNLSQKYFLPQNIPTLILGATNDLVVPPDVIHENFKTSNAKIIMHHTGQHVLGWQESHFVQQKILEFI